MVSVGLGLRMTRGTGRQVPSLKSYLGILAVVGGFLAPSVRAQSCAPGWTSGALSIPGINGSVHVLRSATLGSSTLLYAGGAFSQAGTVAANNIARWNGTSWATLSSGTNGTVTSLVTHNDGTGNALYAGGAFTTAGAATVNGIARWNGTSWSAVGTGVGGGTFGTQVQSLAVFDEGAGPKLFAAGNFMTAGGQPASFVARWTGAAWQPVGGGITGDFFGSVRALAVFNAGSGNALYAGGRFTAAGGMSASALARWNGTAWSPVSTGVDGTVLSLQVHTDPSGTALYVGGSFGAAGGVPASGVARWNGTAFSALGTGLGGGVFASQAEALASYFDPSGAALLVVGGTFGSAGGLPVGHLAGWNGSAWQSFDFGADAPVHALAVHDDGSGAGRAFYAGGEFTAVGTVAANAVARRVIPGPAITTQPVGLSACQTASVTLTTTAIGNTPLTYQWRKNTTNIGGATSPSFSIPGAVPADSGTYDCVVTNGCGSATTAPAVVAIDVPVGIVTQPQNQSVCAGSPFTLAVTLSGGVAPQIQWRKNTVPIAGATALTLDFPSPVAADSGTYDVVVQNACTTLTSQPAMVVVDPGPSITMQPVAQHNCYGQPVAVSVAATGTPPLTYTWKRVSPGGGVTVVQQGASNSYAIAALDAGSPGDYFCEVSQANTCGGATSASVPISIDQPPLISVPPQPVTACINTPVTFTATITGAMPMTFQWRRNGSVINGATGPSYTIAAVVQANAGSYTVTATNACGTATSSGAVLTVRPGPSITLQPQPQNLCVGATLNLAVAATSNGTGILTYQWRRNTVPINGATSPTLTIPNLTAGQGGAYSCAVSNGCLTQNSSNAAIVMVNALPQITQQPSPVAAPRGQPASFTVAATGVGLFYQWRHDGMIIPGANAATYAIPAVQPGDMGVYDVVVSGPCGSVASQTALLSVLGLTLDLAQPGGAGSAFIQNGGGTAGAIYLTIFSLDPTNAASPGQGPWFGLWIAGDDIVAQYLTNTPPFVGVLDTNGQSVFSLPAGTLDPVLSGLTVYAITVTYDLATTNVAFSNIDTLLLL